MTKRTRDHGDSLLADASAGRPFPDVFAICHAAAMAELSSKLRLTPKSRWSARTAENEIRNAPKSPLWELR
jgi:hypothetical protein